jgi:uncharacterized Tic20 family protein
MNPFETPVLPALPRNEQAVAMPVAAAKLRLVLALHGDDLLEVWDDRIVTADQVYVLDEDFSARVTTDWRAPLTVEPELGLALLDARRRWNLYIPADEAQIWHAAYVLRAVCEARGIELADLSQSASQIQSYGAPIGAGRDAMLARPAPVEAIGHPAVWEASPLARRLDLGTPSDAVLMAIAHLSVLFMPVLLPLAIWAALRQEVPHVAAQAREAMRFQLGFSVLALALLGFAGYEALAHGVASAATTGLAAFVVLLAGSLVYAFYAATQAVRGRDFLYFGWFR